MYSQHLSYTLPVLVLACACFFATPSIWQLSSDRVNKVGVVLLVSAGVWAATSAAEVAAVSLSAQMTWNKLQFLGIVVAPVGWFVFVLYGIDRERRLTWPVLAAIGIIPALTLVLVWTNEAHHLVWLRSWLETGRGFTTVEHAYGPWFLVHITFSNALMLVATFLLVRAMRRAERTGFAARQAVLLGAVVLPWLTNTLNLLGARSLLRLDWTPMTLALTTLIAAWDMTFRAARSERDLLDTIMEHSLAHVAYLDTQFRFVRVNKGYVEGSGHSLEELIGRSHFELFPDAENQAIFERARDSGESVSFRAKPFEYAEQPERGVTCWDWDLTPVKARQGSVKGLVLSLVDVTDLERAKQELERSRNELEERVARRTGELQRTNDLLNRQIEDRETAQAALRESQSRLVEAQRIAHVGNWGWDIVHSDLHWSDEVYRIFGLAPQEFGATYEAFLAQVHPEDQSLVDQAVRRALSEGQPYSIEHRIVRSDGSERVVHERAEVIRDNVGQPIRMVGTVQDITALKRAERSLQERANQLSLLNVLGHEVGASLTLEQVVQASLRGLVESIRPDLALFFVLGGETLYLKGVHAPGLGTWDGDDRAHPMGECLCGLAARERQPIYASDAWNDPRCTRQECKQAGVRSFAALPLVWGGEALGVLGIASRDQADFEGHAAFLEALAGEVALGLQSALNLEQLAQRAEALSSEVVERRRAELQLAQHAEELVHGNDLLQALSRVTAAIQSSIVEEQVLETLGGELAAIDLGCAVMRVDADTGDLVQRFARIRPGSAALIESLLGGALQGHRISRPAGLYEQVLNSREPAYCQALPALLSLWSSRGSQEQIHVLLRALSLEPDTPTVLLPLVEEQRVWGILTIWGQGIGPNDVSPLLMLASQVSTALQRARLTAEIAEVETLRELSRLRSELIANVSHELRTPLGVIKLIATMLLREDTAFDAATQRGFIGDIAQEAESLEDIVESLLMANRLEQGRVHLERSPVDLAESIGRAVDSVRRGVAGGGHIFELDLPAEPLVAYVDARRIEQVLRNLLDNAVKYSPEGGVIRLAGRRQGAGVLLSVTDQGIGIPPEECERIFERFYRVDHALSRATRGAGLGLAICRGLVDLHGGRLWCESEPGAGSCFSLSLPGAPPHEPDLSPDQPSRGLQAGGQP